MYYDSDPASLCDRRRDTGSMNEAAKKLFISQPSLSQALRELEKEIGIEIFLRNNRGVILTEEAKSSWDTQGR